MPVICHEYDDAWRRQGRNGGHVEENLQRTCRSPDSDNGVVIVARQQKGEELQDPKDWFIVPKHKILLKPHVRENPPPAAAAGCSITWIIASIASLSATSEPPEDEDRDCRSGQAAPLAQARSAVSTGVPHVRRTNHPFYETSKLAWFAGEGEGQKSRSPQRGDTQSMRAVGFGER
jgi:hypothetical protein